MRVTVLCSSPGLRCFSSSVHQRIASSTLLGQSRFERHAPLDVHPEVQEALATNKPVVALETAVVTNGMPHPANLETARSLEDIVRSTGSIPATIGIIRGRVKIGLNASELERLGDTKSNTSVVKVSRRDIGPVLAMRRDGGTTCSSTLIFAALAGIKVCYIVTSISTFNNCHGGLRDGRVRVARSYLCGH